MKKKEYATPTIEVLQVDCCILAQSKDLLQDFRDAEENNPTDID